MRSARERPAGRQIGMPWHTTEGRDERQGYGTPWALYRGIERVYGLDGFTLDVCAEPWSSKCEHYFTAEDDALTRDWLLPSGKPSRAWVNPPFVDIAAWVRKAWLEHQRGHCETAVFITPNRRDQQWWHRIVKVHAAFWEDVEGRPGFVFPPGRPRPIPRSKLQGAPHPDKGVTASGFEAGVVFGFRRGLLAAELREAPSIAQIRTRLYNWRFTQALGYLEDASAALRAEWAGNPGRHFWEDGEGDLDLRLLEVVDGVRGLERDRGDVGWVHEDDWPDFGLDADEVQRIEGEVWNLLETFGAAA